MTIWTTSDTHFFHSNIIKYSNRPFKDAHEMNEHIIKNWDALVKPEDDIYHLGDFAFCNDKQLIGLLPRLNGNLHIILGNHDQVITKAHDQLLSTGLVKSIQTYKEVNYSGKLFVLFHYAMRTWNKKHHGSILCYGHTHDKLPPLGRSLDVGVDSTVLTTEYRPYSFDEIIKWAEKQEYGLD